VNEQVDVRRGAYHDSVTLMQVSKAVAATPRVSAVQVAMATELNVEVLTGMGFTVPGDAGANDLLIAVRGQDPEGVSAGLAAVDAALSDLRRRTSAPQGMGAPPEPRTLGSAIERGEANLVVISVPGGHAVIETHDAIDRGASVMLFSDNVSVEDEVALKRAADAADVLVMGPDCGTAVVSGVALGFANVVRRGPVGIVAASGTGAQQVMCLLDAADVGVSHCLGVGGRDLKAAVGGLAAKAALRALAADEATQDVIVVSKPPAQEVLDELAALAAELKLTVRWAILGAGRPDLTTSTERALAEAGRGIPTWPSRVAEDGDPGTRGAALRGLFCGGTLAEESILIAAPVLGRVMSNIAHDEDLLLTGAMDGPGHLVIDFGDDGLTRGRAHPMIDPTLRMERIASEARDAECGVLLLDLVLGHGAHPDPAGDLAEAIRAAKAAAGRDLPVVVSLVGTDSDPQDRAAAEAALADAGASVFLSNAAATRHALALLGHDAARLHPVEREQIAGETTPVPAICAHSTGWRSESGSKSGEEPLRGLLSAEPVVATAGVSLFADALTEQAVHVVQTEWQPANDAAREGLARVMADRRRAAANAEALARMTAAEATLVDVVPAADALGLERGTFLHAGPPIEWERASGPLKGALIGAVLFEGLAETPEDAERALARGDFAWEPCHHRDAVGPMAGVVSPSMWMYELADDVHGNRSWCSLNEGLGKVLRYGAYGQEVIDRLHWMNSVLGPILQQSVRASGPFDIKAILTQMLQMGDEGHNRNRAGSLMLLRELLPGMITADAPSSDIAEAVRFSGANEHFFLNLGMPACKLATLAAHGIPGSSVVTTMARNGTDFGIRVSGTGEQWFTGPANTPEGLFLGSYGPEDANPDIGDSAITETGGIGGFAMAAAPAIVKFVGGDVPFALTATQTMYEITQGEHPTFQVPILDFRGTPTGIDVTKVIRTGILPQINTGMAGRVAGTGQVGAGLVTPPMHCFTGAIDGLAAAVREAT
jgi:succinyl-CoA synthetase alpha subunit